MSRQVKIRITEDEYIQLEKEASASNLSVAALSKAKVLGVSLDRVEEESLIAEALENLSELTLESNDSLKDVKILLKLILKYSLSTIQIIAHDSDDEGKKKIQQLVKMTDDYAEEIVKKAGVV